MDELIPIPIDICFVCTLKLNFEEANFLIPAIYLHDQTSCFFKNNNITRRVLILVRANTQDSSDYFIAKCIYKENNSA